ncbi:MAG: non-ribosomal peptide synthetase, partial [Blastocatellia bacterium AA13]
MVSQLIQDKSGADVVSKEVFVLPTSFAQARLWFLDRMEPGSAVYNLPAAVRFSGDLDVNALESALNAIIERHETLRTTFASVDGRPVQVIAPRLVLELPVIRIEGLDKTERSASADRLIGEEVEKTFNLAEGPLIRALLLELDDREHVLVVTMHHIICDGWSLGVFVREMSALYNGNMSGRAADIGTLPIQYADYASWQKEWLSGDLLKGQTDYWREQLSDLPVLELPTDHPRPRVQSHNGATDRFEISAELASSLKRLSTQNGATLFMTLLAAFKVLLMRYSSQKDLAVGSPIAGRERAEVEPLIGFFANTVVLRTGLSTWLTFDELLQRVKQTCLGAYSNQDMPFETLMEELRPGRDISRNPFFQVMFVMQESLASEIALNGVTLSQLEIETATAKFDLTLMVAEREQGLKCALEYNTDIYEKRTME